VNNQNNNHALTDKRVPYPDLRGSIWFDRESDGPYTLIEMEETILKSPRQANDFHVCNRLDLKYVELLPERMAQLKSRIENE